MEKRFNQFCYYISQIKAGKTAMICAPDYVVVDWQTWKNLNKKEKKVIMFTDECSEITEEMWDMIEKILKSSIPSPNKKS